MYQQQTSQRENLKQRLLRACYAIRTGSYLPIYVLRNANSYYYSFLTVIAICGLAIVFGGSLITSAQLNNFLLLTSLSRTTQSFLSALAVFGLWLLALPFVLTAAILPVQSFYLREELRFAALTKHTITALRDGFRAQILALLIIFRIGFPAMILLSAACLLDTDTQSVLARRATLIITVTVCLISFVRSFPYVFLPLFSLCGRVPPLQCLHWAPRLFWMEWIEVSAFAAIGALAILAVQLLSPIESFSVAAQLLILWFILTAMTVPVMRVLRRISP